MDAFTRRDLVAFNLCTRHIKGTEIYISYVLDDISCMVRLYFLYLDYYMQVLE